MLSFRICIVHAHERTFNSCVQCVCARSESFFGPSGQSDE